MGKSKLVVHDVTNWFTADGEKRVSVHVSFFIEGKKERMTNVLPLEIKFDEDGDVVNGHQYCVIFLDVKKNGKRKMRTCPIEFLFDCETIKIALEAAVQNELKCGATW